MPAFDFPPAPFVGQTFTPPGSDLTYTWTGLTWNSTITSGSGTVTQINTGVGLIGGPITTAGTISMEDTAVVPGAYNAANIVVDQQGRITFASQGQSSGVIIQDTPPSGAVSGNLWWDSSTDNSGGRLYVYYTDETSAQWVNTNPSGGTGDVDVQLWKRDGTVLSPFADGDAITTSGNIQSGGDALDAAEAGVVLRNSGLINVTRATGSNVFAGLETGNATPTSLITSDGNITTTGQIQAGDGNAGGFKVEAGNFSDPILSSRLSGTTSFLLKANGDVSIGGDVAGGNPNLLLGNDGKITAVNSVLAGDPTLDDDSVSGLNLGSGGTVTSKKQTGSTGEFFRGYTGTAKIANINASGVLNLGTNIENGSTTQIQLDGSTGDVKFGSTTTAQTKLGLRQLIITSTKSSGPGSELTLQNSGQGTDATNLITSITKKSGDTGYSAKLEFTQSGNMEFGGKSPTSSGANLPSTTITFTASGNIDADGTVSVRNTVLNLDSGALDVGDRLKKADDALKALKVSAAAASDFAALKAAVVAALANI